MKTKAYFDCSYRTARVPEIIFWVIAISVFTSILFGHDAVAQNATTPQDTVWLTNGDTLTGKIELKNLHYDSIIILTANLDGEYRYTSLHKKTILKYEVDPENLNKSFWQYRLELKDGTVISGKITGETGQRMFFEMSGVGQLVIQKSKIRKVVPLDINGKPGKSYWFANPHATRLFFAPTAIPLKKGEGYYQNIYLVVNMFNYGLIDNLSVGAGFDFISMFASASEGEWAPILNFNFKSGHKVGSNVHVGVGGLYVTQVGEFDMGILYGLGTFGSFNSNFTIGTGWGFVNGLLETKPFIMLGGMVRMSEKAWFVTENWMIPANSDGPYYPVFSYGVRFAGRKIAVDLGFINNKDIASVLVIGAPYVDFVVKF